MSARPHCAISASRKNSLHLFSRGRLIIQYCCNVGLPAASRRNNNGVSQLSSAANWFQRRHTSWQHCVVHQQRRGPNPRRRRQVCQRVRPSRHVRQCLGVVPGLVWTLFIRKRDKPHRTHDWHVPFVARRRLGPQLRPLPRVAARRLLARLHQLRRRLPCREDSVISSSHF